MRRARPIIALAFVVGLAPLHAAPAWQPSLAATATWNDNASNAERASDEIGALQLRADASARARHALPDGMALVYGASVSAEWWPRFNDLDEIAAGPQIELQRKFGLGPLAPIVALGGNARLVGAQDSDRAGIEGDVRLEFRKRLSDFVRVGVSGELSRHSANASVFSRTGRALAASLDYDLDDVWRLSISAQWRDGDVVSYATPPRPDLVAIARVRQASTAFSRPMIVYAIRAHSLEPTASLSRALDEETSLTVSVGVRDVRAGEFSYVSRFVSFGLGRRF